MTAIRPAVPADVPLILRYLADMAAEAGETTGSTAESLLAHGFGPTPRFHGLIAESDAPLGMILYFPEYSTWRGEMGLFVQDVYVAPAGRGQGLGRQLLAAAMAAADWQPQFLTLMVAHVNQNARDFYAALGLTLRDEADQLILEGEGLTALMTA
ncbi:MAG: GNAT family N-acetyltransferase [Pseudorhodobacter sp.]|nr:MAG: GNAT family N-acetyltransferase [Pseudorhodobacter sp.]